VSESISPATQLLSSAPPASVMCEPGPAEHRATLGNPARLAALAASELMDSATEAAFDRFTRLAATWLRVPVALVSLVDDKRQFFKSAVGLGEPWATRRETPLTHSFCQYGVTTGEPLIVMDAREHPWLRQNSAIAELGAVAYAGVPLVTSEQQVIGMLCAIDSAPRRWSDDDIATLRELGAMVATEIELRGRVRALRASEAASEENRTLLRSVLDCMEDAVVVIAPDGKIMLTNEAARRDRPAEALETTESFTTYGLFLPDGVTPLELSDAPGMRALRGETVRDVEILSRLPGKPEKDPRKMPV